MTMLEDETPLLPSEAAKFLHTTIETLANWREQGGGPEYTRVGSRIFYWMSKLRAFRPPTHGAPS
jgi:hypothetical protein